MSTADYTTLTKHQLSTFFAAAITIDPDHMVSVAPLDAVAADAGLSAAPAVAAAVSAASASQRLL